MIQTKNLTLASNTATKILGKNPARVGFKVINTELSQAVRVKQGSAPGTANADEVRTISFGGLTPGSGSFKVEYKGLKTAAIASSANAAAVQSALRLLAGLGSVTVSGSFAAGFAVTMTGAELPTAPFKVVENTLQTAGTACVNTLTFSGTPTQGTLQLMLLVKDKVLKNYFREAITDKLTVTQLSTANLQAYLRAFLNDATLTVGGSFGAGLTITSSVGMVQGKPKVVENLLKAADTAEVQTLTFAGVPSEGGFKLSLNGVETAEIAFDDLAADVQTAVRTLPGLAAATVSGDFTTGFVITLTGAVYPHQIEVSENTLDVEADIETTTPYAPGVDRTVTPTITTLPVEPVDVPGSVAVTTPGTSSTDGESVAGGATLDYSENGGTGEVYAYSAGATAAIKVVEVF